MGPTVSAILRGLPRSAFSRPRDWGRWADKVGARRARLVAALVQLTGIGLFYPLGFGIMPLVCAAAAGQSSSVRPSM